MNKCIVNGRKGDRTRNDGMRFLHQCVLSTNQSSFSSLSVVLSRGSPMSRETSRVRRNNRRCSSSRCPLHFRRRRSSEEWCTHRCIAVRFVCPGACRRWFRFLSRSSRLFFIIALAWVDSRHVSQNSVHFRRAWWRTVVVKAYYFQLLFILLRSILKWSNCSGRKKVRKEKYKVQLKRKKSH